MAIPTALHISRPCMRCIPRPHLRAGGGGGGGWAPLPGRGGVRALVAVCQGPAHLGLGV